MDLPSFMGLRDGDGSGGDLCVSKNLSPQLLLWPCIIPKKERLKKPRCIMIHIVRSSLRKSTVFAGPF